ncbi:hypothetical protein BST63_16345 [Bradyrhizobium canariense]|uniref:Uncharacterized protein n=1 Tax=Bradyrhizobium canariense TaxID=255045 RepID=A0ABX3X352_9BRAD|nr:hypothetical protein BSR47_20895 [Bradyrhizobium canariense]OSJ28795.1 hypothetical protein BST63_16345 [Bradyrhizobium canariense]
MRNSSHSSHRDQSRCCAMCGGKFGLIRHYSWRTALCSKKCVGRFKARREADHIWLCWLHLAQDTRAMAAENAKATRALAE